MNKPVHYEVEVLYGTAYRGACGVYAERHSYTPHYNETTCGKCRKALGMEEE